MIVGATLPSPEDGKSFRFIEGHYKLEVFAHLLGDPKPIRLFFQQLEISRDISTALQQERGAGLYFDWGSDSSRYLPHLETRPPSPNAEDFLRIFGESTPTE
jgi:hypothetical protein